MCEPPLLVLMWAYTRNFQLHHTFYAHTLHLYHTQAYACHSLLPMHVIPYCIVRDVLTISAYIKLELIIWSAHIVSSRYVYLARVCYLVDPYYVWSPTSHHHMHSTWAHYLIGSHYIRAPEYYHYMYLAQLIFSSSSWLTSSCEPSHGIAVHILLKHDP